ncbi:MAG: nuclease-related domain-containing protein [Candidatus Altiarchaeota archaeon]|nr:nuclease-related domain-containing protein [Candidatus Altiarchaeota archaeon]
MRVIKAKSGSVYVWNYIALNKSRMMLFLTLFFLATMLFVLGIRPYASVGLVMIPLSYVLGVYAYMNYLTWSSGPRGERRVLEDLMRLSDDYFLARNVVIAPSRGDIDYIVIGPTGVFVVETKNVGGVVSCDGDTWSRHKVGRGGRIYRLGVGNPSRQVNRSAKNLKDFLLKHKADIFGSNVPHLWVNSVLVFTNENASLNLRNPTIDVVSPAQVGDFIIKQKKGLRLSKAVVGRMADAIARGR